MLAPFERPTVAHPRFPFRVSRFPLPRVRLHDRSAVAAGRQGFAGLFLGQVQVTPLMQAIAQAEGFNVAGSIPQRANNPGDVEVGDVGYGTINGITIFASVDDGWAALANQISSMASGTNSHYPAGATLAQVGIPYSGGDPNWANNVASYLGVSTSTPFASLAGGIVASTPDTTMATATTIPDWGYWATAGAALLGIAALV
jgi:hypothetical protein